MACYRIFYFNAQGTIVAHDEFESETDSDALIDGATLSGMRSDCETYELWQETRHVHEGQRKSDDPAQ